MAKTDTFGRRFINVACKDRKGRGYPSGIITIGGKTYKVEPSESKTDGVDAWVRITELPRDRGGFGGGRERGGNWGERSGGYSRSGGSRRGL